MICGGEIIDGMGLKFVCVDIVIDKGKIIWIGDLLGVVVEIEFDVMGKMVIFGFVDLYMYLDV